MSDTETIEISDIATIAIGEETEKRLEKALEQVLGLTEQSSVKLSCGICAGNETIYDLILQDISKLKEQSARLDKELAPYKKAGLPLPANLALKQASTKEGLITIAERYGIKPCHITSLRLHAIEKGAACPGYLLGMYTALSGKKPEILSQVSESEMIIGVKSACYENGACPKKACMHRPDHH